MDLFLLLRLCQVFLYAFLYDFFFRGLKNILCSFPHAHANEHVHV